MKMKIGAGYVMAVALTGLGATAASAQESGTVTFARTAAPTEACAVVHAATAEGELAFTTKERVALQAVRAGGEAGEVKVYRTTRAEDGSYVTTVVSPALEATTVEADG